MAQVVMYVSLWDDQNREASFSGYYRQPISMNVGAGLAANAHSITWMISASAPVNVTTLKMHKDMWGEAILECRLTNPIQHVMGNGDSISFQPGSVNITLDGTTSAFLDRKAQITVETFEDFMEKNPDAIPREVWEAAFMAGHQTAYTLITGEPE